MQVETLDSREFIYDLMQYTCLNKSGYKPNPSLTTDQSDERLNGETCMELSLAIANLTSINAFNLNKLKYDERVTRSRL